MAENLPIIYKAQLLNGFSQPFEFGTLPIPELKENELLIKVKASPINPYDQGFITGFLEQPQNPSVFPITAGCEGSGVVANIGTKVVHFKPGQRVTFFTNSRNQAYGEYAVTTENFVILLDDDVSYEESASATGNPLTVIAMYDVAKNSKALVSSAAASQLGRQLQRYFTKRGIAVINIVRRQEQVDILKSDGAQYILNETEPNFIVELKELSEKLNVSIFFDPVGGDQTGTILAVLPKGTTAYMYGNLSGKPISNVSVFDLARGDKTIKGFTLFNWYPQNPGKLQEPAFQKEFNRNLKDELRTTYAHRFPLEQLNEAFQAFQKYPASNGKVLIYQD